jgi:hypothetical protein
MIANLSAAKQPSHYEALASINVNDRTEKKNNLTYLSWAWAVDQLLRADPAATWEYGEPRLFGGNTLMVFCTVTAFGKSMTAQLPVMDHKNRAIAEPDAFQVNVTMQRCLAKAIALHGIGLYIYAGEDLPYEEKVEPPAQVMSADAIEATKKLLAACETKAQLRDAYTALPEDIKAVMKEYVTALAKRLTKPAEKVAA